MPKTFVIGIVDTMFARGDMGGLAEQTIRKEAPTALIHRVTVPGIKDLPVACKRLLERRGCNLVIALGMPGKMPLDKQCAHEASLGIQQAQLMTNKPILEVFVHEDEGKDDKDLASIMRNRTVKHSINAVKMLCDPAWLRARAGTGERQGKENAKPIQL